MNTMQDEPIEQQELHDYLLRAPLFDGQGNVVDINKRFVRGLSDEQIKLLKVKIDEQSEKMASLRGDTESIHDSPSGDAGNA